MKSGKHVCFHSTLRLLQSHFSETFEGVNCCVIKMGIIERHRSISSLLGQNPGKKNQTIAVFFFQDCP